MFDQPDFRPKRKKSKAKKAKQIQKLIEVGGAYKADRTLKHSEEVSKELAKFLVKQIEIEKRVERIKCELALYPEFNLAQAFKIIDRDEVGWVSQKTFTQMLISMTQEKPTTEFLENAALLFSRYGVHGNG